VTNVATASVLLRMLFRWNSPIYLPRSILSQETMATNLTRMEKRFATNNSIVVTRVIWLSPRPIILWRSSISTQIILVAPNTSPYVQAFRGDALFQQILFVWRHAVIATA